MQDSRLRVAAIGFLNPAPLMWDFEHPPLEPRSPCAIRLTACRLPSAPAPRLGHSRHRPHPHCRPRHHPRPAHPARLHHRLQRRVRSLFLVRRANQPLAALRSVAADTASRTTLAYTRILFHKWGNPAVPFLPLAADLDPMLDQADAAIVIGDPALLALEERANRFERTGEELVYHDLAHEWHSLTGLTFVSAVWATSLSGALDEAVAQDFVQSRIHGLQNIDALVAEWSRKFPIPESTIRAYLTTNIHYVLDEECIQGIRGFFRIAAEVGVLPAYTLATP